MSHWALLAGAAAIGACGGGGDRAGQAAASGAMMGHMDSGDMGRMDGGGMGMEGMSMQSTQLMLQMRSHMDSMMRASPQQMQGMMAMHELMMSQMMDAMGADMRGMNRSPSPEWSALTDSVKQDLAELPELKGQKLSARMPGHADRVNRLMAMHEQMMRK
jgi:hypothetical protein